ncbi:hypothetical protein L9F63_010953, partial [Diploptera punctata]
MIIITKTILNLPPDASFTNCAGNMSFRTHTKESNLGHEIPSRFEDFTIPNKSISNKTTHSINQNLL